jgi:hypothetical protein
MDIRCGPISGLLTRAKRIWKISNCIGDLIALRFHTWLPALCFSACFIDEQLICDQKIHATIPLKVKNQKARPVGIKNNMSHGTMKDPDRSNLSSPAVRLWSYSATLSIAMSPYILIPSPTST